MYLRIKFFSLKVDENVAKHVVQKKEDERKGDLHAIEHLQKEVEEKVVEVVDVRQAMVRQAAEARKRLRIAEESLIERNTLVLECKKKLRLQKNDKDTEIRELERAIRILRGNSNLHNQIAALTTEITTLKKDRERREMEKKSHLNQIKTNYLILTLKDQYFQEEPLLSKKLVFVFLHLKVL